MDIELLRLKTIHELRSLASQKGLVWARTEKKADLISRLAEFHDYREEKKVEKVEKPVEKPTTLEQQQILDAIKDNMERGLKIRFLDDAWHMRSAKGKEDTGSMTMPLTTIKRIANMLI